jgi:DNA-binding MarR family transcriptional regulator
MSEVYLPYNGTAGWSGSSTSKVRAKDNVIRKRENSNQALALALLKRADDGLTWKELAAYNSWHHGTASGVLSVLHKVGFIIRGTNVRNKCKVYYHLTKATNVVAESHGRTKLCPHCGNDINA